MGFGDELQIGQVRMRLERARRMTVDATRAGAPGRRTGAAPRPRARSVRARAGSSSGCSASSRSRCVVGSLSLGRDGQRLVPAVRRAGHARLPRGAARRPRWPRSSPAVGPTRSCCRRSRCSAASRCCSCSGCPQDLVNQTFFGTTLGLAEVQLVWLLVALAIATTLGIVVRSDSWLRRYKYTWAAVGVGLLLLTFVFGTEINGQRLTLQLGPFSGQPTELLKVILVVFLAGYLSENRALLVEQDTRLGPLRLPPLPYLAPMVAMWAIALVIVVIQRDLGAALLFFGVFLAMLYVATGRISLVIIGLVLFLLGSALMAKLFDHVRTGSTSGSTRSPIRSARATRSSRRSTPSRAAACSASDSAPGCPRSAGVRRSPRSTPTSRSPRSARSSASSGSWRSWGSTSSSSSAACGSARPRRTTSGRCSRSGSRWSSASRRSSSRPATSRSCR